MASEANNIANLSIDSLNNDYFLHVNSPVGMNDSLYMKFMKSAQHSIFAHLNIQTMMQVTLIII